MKLDLMVSGACFPGEALVVEDSLITTGILLGASWLNQYNKAVYDFRQQVLCLVTHSSCLVEQLMKHGSENEMCSVWFLKMSRRVDSPPAFVSLVVGKANECAQCDAMFTTWDVWCREFWIAFSPIVVRPGEGKVLIHVVNFVQGFGHFGVGSRVEC